MNLQKLCISSGVIDRLLMRIGHLQGESPRNSERMKQFEDSLTETETELTVNLVPDTNVIKTENTEGVTTNKISEDGKKPMLWKPGFGHGYNDNRKESAMRENERKQKQMATIHALNCLALFLEYPDEHNTVDWNIVFDIVGSSPL